MGSVQSIMDDADDWDQPFSDSDMSENEDDDSDNGDYDSECGESQYSVMHAAPVNAAEARMLQKRNGEGLPPSQS